MNKIPFVDLTAQYQSIKSEIDEAIAEVIAETAFISGKYARQFEADFAAYLGTSHVIACANGTDSLEILLQAMGVSQGDEVIVPAMTWISTSEAVSSVGATPVFVDVDPQTYTLNPDLLEAAITEKTRVIIPVHLYGHPADMPRIMEIARRHDLKVLEDCAQAHGASIDGKLVGSWGDAASWSFYPGKNLGAYGDAGAMSTASEELAIMARSIANHGQPGKKHHHVREGRNSRMDGLQAAILSVKLKHLPRWTEQRIHWAQRYSEQLAGLPVDLPSVGQGIKHVFHVYALHSSQRGDMQAHLSSRNIAHSVHYPTPLPAMPPYQHLPTQPFPVAQKISDQSLSLPLYPEMTEEMIQYVCEQIRLSLSLSESKSS
ncbi:MAG: DegT/DnrJ/EryC1/StrS family aminotransferase [Bacteroidota bacterium]